MLEDVLKILLRFDFGLAVTQWREWKDSINSSRCSSLHVIKEQDVLRLTCVGRLHIYRDPPRVHDLLLLEVHESNP